MKRLQTVFLMTLVVVLTVLPLWRAKLPEPGPAGKKVEIFTGADEQAQGMIGTIAPDYVPWFKPLMEPPSGETESLLFALQAALGAGFIAYYLGVSVTRSKMRREQGRNDKC
jgi:cobalt/nickel transport protein